MRINIKQWLPIVALTVLGAILRLYQIGYQCMGYDETYSLMMAKMPAAQLIWASLTVDYNPPLFYLAGHIAYLLSGSLAYSIRFPSVIFGVTLIPVSYWLGLEYRNHATGLYCAAVITVLYSMVYYSQYARCYSLSVLCFALALIFWLRIKNGDRAAYLLFGILAALNIWVHYYSLIPIVFLGLDLFLTQNKNLVLKATLLFATICSPILIVFTHVRDRIALTYGFTIFNLVYATPLELFNVLFPFFALACIFEGVEGKIKYSRELLVIGILSFCAAIGFTFLTPMVPHYFLTLALIPIIVAAATLDRLLNYESGKAVLVTVILTIVLLIFQQESFISHYTVQQYACTGLN